MLVYYVYTLVNFLCRYIRMGLLLVRCWARVRRVSLGRERRFWVSVDVLVCYGCVAGGVPVLC